MFKFNKIKKQIIRKEPRKNQKKIDKKIKKKKYHKYKISFLYYLQPLKSKNGSEPVP